MTDDATYRAMKQRALLAEAKSALLESSLAFSDRKCDLALAECERLRADLRDTFAGIALGAMIGNTDKDGHTRGKKGVPVLANYSYEYADAMLAARAKP